MMEIICTTIFVVAFLVLAFFIKKDLYCYEHESDIVRELDAFDKNITEINDLTNIPDYQLGSGHLYKK
ncbi:hypothetical protein FG167_12705 [Lacinutrix sp. WUR7]|uniref:hypothetical protein n=1 Tax=Lacinutrix sp. WUR7 TaxID=2653681 RepID=UPI00193D2366|nr:hypothetical protein [Lacinutrix sp. WUR7]QRM90054.1 hypothetical protein FG167_12705 [Lacinutrix sp. WUR7]